MNKITPQTVELARALVMLARAGEPGHGQGSQGLRGKKFATRVAGDQGGDDAEMKAFLGPNANMGGMVAWGQSKAIVFRLVQNDIAGYEQLAVSVVKNDLVQTEELGEPILRTFSCFVQPNCQQVGNDPSLPPVISELCDVPIVGRLTAAVGGNAQTIYFSLKNGTVLTVPAMTWDLAVWIQPPPGRVTIPDGKTVTVGVTVSTMPHPGGTMVPTMDFPALY